MKNLKELVEQATTLFKVKNIDDLGKSLMNCVSSNNNTIYQAFTDMVDGDLSVDWMQMIYQYYMADRENLKQDYTPKCLAELLSQYAQRNNITEIVDICAGSGALTIQQWNANKDIIAECQEIDKTVIPYLLFNLALRNIEGVVYHKDVLLNKIFETYILTRGDKFAAVHKQSTI